jgi:hypothetical protein
MENCKHTKFCNQCYLCTYIYLFERDVEFQEQYMEMLEKMQKGG